MTGLIRHFLSSVLSHLKLSTVSSACFGRVPCQMVFPVIFSISVVSLVFDQHNSNWVFRLEERLQELREKHWCHSSDCISVKIPNHEHSLPTYIQFLINNDSCKWDVKVTPAALKEATMLRISPPELHFIVFVLLTSNITILISEVNKTKNILLGNSCSVRGIKHYHTCWYGEKSSLVDCKRTDYFPKTMKYFVGIIWAWRTFHL